MSEDERSWYPSLREGDPVICTGRIVGWVKGKRLYTISFPFNNQNVLIHESSVRLDRKRMIKQHGRITNLLRDDPDFVQACESGDMPKGQEVKDE